MHVFACRKITAEYFECSTLNVENFYFYHNSHRSEKIHKNKFGTFQLSPNKCWHNWKCVVAWWLMTIVKYEIVMSGFFRYWHIIKNIESCPMWLRNQIKLIIPELFPLAKSNSSFSWCTKVVLNLFVGQAYISKQLQV